MRQCRPVEKIDCGCNDPRIELEFHAGGEFVSMKGCPHRDKVTHHRDPATFRVTAAGPDGTTAEFIVQVLPISLLSRQWDERRQADTLSA